MEQRLVEFIAALRAFGVRISISESQDAFNATEHMGIQHREIFCNSLRATLVKEAQDQSTFDKLFPLYFGNDEPPLINLNEELSPEERALLQQALRALLEQMGQQDQEGQRGQRSQSGAPSSDQLNMLMQLLQSLLQGQNFSQDQLDEAGQRSGLSNATRSYQQRWVEQRMMRQLGMQLLDKILEQLPDLLREMGMSQQAIEQLMDGMQMNREALAEQIAQNVGSSIIQQQIEREEREGQQSDDIMQRPFDRLSEREADTLRKEIQRLVAQLRSRAALRRKRSKVGTLDVKKTLRTNLRYGGVPMEIKFKHRQLKPKLVLVCDLSTSMRNVVSFLLRMVYELHDQVSSAHSFGFVGDLGSISEDFAEHPPEIAVEVVLARPDLQPGYYSTDLGNSLHTLMQRYAGTIDHRTTVIFVGDGRNNYRDPRLDLMEQIHRRSKRVVWLNPEHPHQWGTGDSDMLEYLPFATAVHRVSNMAELTEAVDKLLTV